MDVLPEFAPTTVEIQTEALGLSPTEVEQLITVPIEQDLLVGVAFLDDIRSQSVAGLSRILLVFEPARPLRRAAGRGGAADAGACAAARLEAAADVAAAFLDEPRADGRAVVEGRVADRDVGAGALDDRARLTGVPGVANVSIWGQRDRQLQVQVDPEHLRDQNVSLLQVLETAGNALWVSC